MAKNDIRSHFQESSDHLLCLTCGAKLNKKAKLSALIKHLQSKKHNTTFKSGDNQFTNESQFKQANQDNHEENNILKCAICDKQFIDEAQFQQHNQDVHQENNTEHQNNILKCAICVKRQLNGSGLSKWLLFGFLLAHLYCGHHH